MLTIQFKGEPMECKGELSQIIRKQPGYRGPKEEYMLSKTKTGGIRLYCAVSGKWMDASLEDIKDPIVLEL
jgi:hypothetical protein